jgi:hypothetical protein
VCRLQILKTRYMGGSLFAGLGMVVKDNRAALTHDIFNEKTSLEFLFEIQDLQ